MLGTLGQEDDIAVILSPSEPDGQVSISMEELYRYLHEEFSEIPF